MKKPEVDDKKKIDGVVSRMGAIAYKRMDVAFVRALHAVHMEAGIELCGVMRRHRERQRAKGKKAIKSIGKRKEVKQWEQKLNP